MSSAGWSTALPSDLAGRAQQNTLGMVIPGRASSSHCARTAAQAGSAPGITTPAGLPRKLLLAGPLLPVPIGRLLPCTGTVSAICCVVWTSRLPACGSDSHAPQLHQWCAILVQVMLVHATLGALLSAAGRVTSSTTTRSRSHLTCPGPCGRACV